MKARKIVDEMDSYVPGKSQGEIAEQFGLNKDEIIKLTTTASTTASTTKADAPTTAPATGNIPPQPKPCTILPKNIASMLNEDAIKQDPIPKRITSRMNTFFLP